MILDGLQGVVCYMDHVLVWGKDQVEHETRLHAVLHKLQETGVTLNMEKCELSRHKVKFLGHILSAESVQPDPDKTKAVRDMKEPSNTGEVCSFLGMVNQLAEDWQTSRERQTTQRPSLQQISVDLELCTTKCI